MDLGLKDKVVLITGATGGIGEAVSKAFFDEGSKLALTSTSQEKIDTLMEKLGNPSEDRVKTYVLDVTNEEEVKKVVEDAHNHFGDLYSLVTVAGYDGKNIKVVDATEENYKRVFDINFYGVVWAMKYALPYMTANKKGSVVVLGSSGSYVGSPGLSAYTSSKHAVAGLVKSVAKEVGPEGVHVNFVAPAAVNTDMMRRIEKNMFGDTKTQEEAMQIIAGGSINKRYAEPEEVADMCLFYASEKTSHIMGHGLRVDGGKYI